MFPLGVYIFFLLILIFVLFICSFVHFSISSALKSDSLGMINHGLCIPFGVGTRYHVLPEHLLCQSKGQVKNIFWLKVCAQTEERQRWNKLETGRKKKKHPRKVKVWVCEGRGKQEACTVCVCRRKRAGSLSGKEDIWERKERKSERKTKAESRTGIDREWGKVRDSGKRKQCEW